MSTIGDILKRKQPREYALLMAMCRVEESEDPDKTFREIENLMRHDAYVRGRGGAIRQVRRG